MIIILTVILVQQMINSKLKKKAKISQIIFPTSYPKTQSSSKQLNLNKSIETLGMRHRLLSKDKSNHNSNLTCKRSLSMEAINKKSSLLKGKPSLNHLGNSKEIKLRSIKKKVNRVNSSNELQKIYYHQLEKNLSRECEHIMRQDLPKRRASRYKIEQISQNMLFLKSKSLTYSKQTSNALPLENPHSKVEPSQHIKVHIEEIAQKDKTAILLENGCSKEQDSIIDIQISQKSISVIEKQFFGENYRHNTLLSNLQTTVNRNFMSQIDSSLIDQLRNIPIFFFSSKLSIKHSTFFKIISIKVSVKQESNIELDIFFNIYANIISKRICLNPAKQRKPQQNRRKPQIRKLQLIKQKLIQRILSYFHRQFTKQIYFQFYQDLISFIEHFAVLQRTYRGLVLIDKQENHTKIKNQDKIFELLKINRFFHFIIKLNFTFYLVKVIFSPQMEIKFTVVYDFTTHSLGNQLSFTRNSPHIWKENKTQAQIYKIFLKVIQEFVISFTEEWKNQSKTSSSVQQMESNAKISQITTESIEKWDEVCVLPIKNINKQYHFIGNIKNFFTFHNQFDFGFYQKPHFLFQNDKYLYSLDEISDYVYVYSYPHSFTYLSLSPKQREAITIPHVSQSIPCKRRQHLVHNMLRREMGKKYKREHQYIRMFFDGKQIRMKQIDENIEIFMQPISNQICHRISLPIKQYPSFSPHQSSRLDMQQASTCLQSFLGLYKLQKSFLYSRMIKHTSQYPVIHYKGLQKFQGQFAFITLYSLPIHQIIELKLFMFRLGRQFIISFDNNSEWLQQINIKQLISNILDLIKGMYFKKLIQSQARKSKKRRLDALQDFLKKHGKSFVNQQRTKKKLDDNIKRRMMKLATFKQNNISMLVSENITMDRFSNRHRQQFLITIRFVPSEELKEQNEWKNQNIQICLHRQNTTCYFRHTSSMKQLVQSVSQGTMNIEQIDFRHINHFFRQIRNRIKDTVCTSDRNIGFIISRLKHFFVLNYQVRPVTASPYKFKLLQGIVYETKESINDDEISSMVSIQLEMEKQLLITSVSNLIFSPYLTSFNKQMTSSSSFSLICRKPISHPHRRYVDREHCIELVDIFRRSEDYQVLKECQSITRELWVNDRVSQTRIVISEWDNGFLSNVKFSQFNKRMFKRITKALKIALI